VRCRYVWTPTQRPSPGWLHVTFVFWLLVGWSFRSRTSDDASSLQKYGGIPVGRVKTSLVSYSFWSVGAFAREPQTALVPCKNMEAYLSGR
jgi:hypothetical protein